MPEGKSILGRVTTRDGVKGIEPLVHSEEVFEYQRRVAALIEAARQYSERPSEEALHALKQAAHNVR